MTKVYIFSTPDPLHTWVCVCDENGTVVDAMPPTIKSQWLHKHIEEVTSAATSILKYRVDAIDDNEYPTVTVVTHPDNHKEEITVVKSGLLMKNAERYGHWNSNTGTFDKVPV